MWTAENRPRYNRDTLRYPSDLSDEEWAHIEALVPPGKRGGGRETGTIEALGKEVARLRGALAEPEALEDVVGWNSGEACRDRPSPEKVRNLKATIRSLRTETNRLNKEVARRNKAIGELHKKLDQEKERAESIREQEQWLKPSSAGLRGRSSSASPVATEQ